MRVRVVAYGPDGYEEMQPSELPRCALIAQGGPRIVWYDVAGVEAGEALSEIAACFDLHPLLLEDLLATDKRPQLSDMGDYLFVAMRAVRYDPQSGEVRGQRVSVALGRNYVVSFRERDDDLFERPAEAIRAAKGQLKEGGSDHLLYALADCVVDSFFDALEEVGERIEDTERRLLAWDGQDFLEHIHDLKTNLLVLRKAIWPLREVLDSLEHERTPLIGDSSALYFRDLYNHAVEIMDTLESSREMVSGMLDIYLSGVSNRINEVMKVLTIIATIFIPLTFVVGLYGMNFRYMPELECRWGYPAVLVFMAAVAGGLLIYFRRRRWL